MNIRACAIDSPTSFRLSLCEALIGDRDAIEAELAHVGSDQVRRAYHRAAHGDERVRMAEWWAARIGGYTQ